jgi:RNA polymerase sigma-70 factor, ECF subfamily
MDRKVCNRSPLTDSLDARTTITDLVQLAQAGSHSAFTALERIYSKRLFSQILAITRHYEDAEDALQDALYKAYIALPDFERRCHIYTWLSRIAINCALMKVRKRSNLREFSLDAPDATNNQEPVRELPNPGWSPEELYRAEEQSRQIDSVVNSLDAISKRVIQLRAHHDYSMEEIARTVNASVPAVKARLSRARHVLRNFLSDHLDPEPVR